MASPLTPHLAVLALAFAASFTAAKEPPVADSDPFVVAIAENNAGAISDLLRAQPEHLTRTYGSDRLSPLHIAARHDAVDAAKVLLNAGADFYARDINGQLPLDLPPGQSINTARQYLRDVNRARNTFLGAVHEQKLEEVKRLITTDPALSEARDIGDGWTPVMTAVHHGNAALLRTLLDAGCSVAGEDFNNGFDAVYHAADKGRTDCLKLLIDAGADVTRTWRVGYGHLPMQMNALHVAAWKGHADTVELLLATRKLNVNARAAAYPMFSPLHFAATEGHRDVVKRLLSAGADTSARDGRRGISALEMAQRGKHEAVAELLR